MKKNKTIYWISTALAMLTGATKVATCLGGAVVN